MMEDVSLPDSPARWLSEISAGQEWRWAFGLEHIILDPCYITGNPPFRTQWFVTPVTVVSIVALVRGTTAC